MTVTNKLVSIFIEENLKIRESQAGKTADFLIAELKKLEEELAKKEKDISLFKQKSGYWFKKNFNENLWHISYYDHILRKEESIEGVTSYILENPVRKGFVSDYREYPFSRSFL